MATRIEWKATPADASRTRQRKPEATQESPATAIRLGTDLEDAALLGCQERPPVFHHRRLRIIEIIGPGQRSSDEVIPWGRFHSHVQQLFPASHGYVELLACVVRWRCASQSNIMPSRKINP